MADLAHLAGAAPLNRALESLAGSDALFSRVGGLDGDPAAVAVAALPPLDLGSITDAGGALSSLPLPLAGASLPGATDGLDVSSLLGSTALTGGSPIDVGSLGSTLGGVLGTVTGVLGGGDAGHPASTLGGIGDLLGGGDPATAITSAVGSTVAAVGHIGSGAAMAVGEITNAHNQPVEQTLNGVIDYVHTGLANAAPELGLAETIPSVVKVGVTLGLGELGGNNLLTGVLNSPGEILSGNLAAPIEAVTGHLGEVLEVGSHVVPNLITDLEHALGGDGGGSLVENVAGLVNGGDPLGSVANALGNVGATVDDLTGGVTGAVAALTSGLGENPVDALNGAIDSIHTGLANAVPELGLPGTIYGTVKVGTTLGLGDIGGDNLVTDVVNLVGGGNPADTLGNVIDHAGALVPAATGLVNGVVSDVEHTLGLIGGTDAPGDLLGNVTGVLSGGDPVGSLTNAVSNAGSIVGSVAGGLTTAVGSIDLAGASPAETLNTVVNEFHNGLAEAAPETGVPSAIYNLMKAGNAIGLGEIGGENVVSDVVNLPSALLGGGDPAGAVGSIVDHAGAIAPAAENIVTGLVSDLGHATGGALSLPGSGGADGLVGALEETVHSATSGGLPEPVASIVGGDLDLGHAGDLGGLGDLVHSLPVGGSTEHHGLGLGLV